MASHAFPATGIFDIMPSKTIFFLDVMFISKGSCLSSYGVRHATAKTAPAGPHLDFVQLAIQPVLPKKLVGRPKLHEPRLIEDQHHVGMVYRGKPVRDHEARSPNHQAIEGLENYGFGLG